MDMLRPLAGPTHAIDWHSTTSCVHFPLSWLSLLLFHCPLAVQTGLLLNYNPEQLFLFPYGLPIQVWGNTTSVDLYEITLIILVIAHTGCCTTQCISKLSYINNQSDRNVGIVFFSNNSNIFEPEVCFRSTFPRVSIPIWMSLVLGPICIAVKYMELVQYCWSYMQSRDSRYVIRQGSCSC